MVTGFPPPGTLRTLVAQASRRALATGALHSLETRLERLESGGLEFEVRMLSSLRQRAADQSDRAAASPPVNPFLPYDPELFVCDLGTRHLALLNKYNVMPEHLLVVTRRFEHQERPLQRADLALLSRLLGEYPALGFYNGGPLAGASQPHRHLQLIPVGEGALPIDRWLAAGRPLPFGHRLCRGLSADPERRAAQLWAFYRESVEALALAREDGRLGPYNLLVTEAWALMVPRRADGVVGISINALGFAGLLLVRTPEELRRLRAFGPCDALAAVSG